ncbi:hypothetical protein Alg130_11612 [Pyrenophora tritici-repentis]|nr:hypothetical protein Alg130_11612 [Pyrenophora tritici-repentis]
MSQSPNTGREAQLGLMESPNTIHKDAADRDKQFPTDAHTGKAFPRPTSYATITSPSDVHQDPSQRGRISQLVLAMAALHLDNKKTEEIVQEKYEMFDPNSMDTGPQHAVDLDREYVFVNYRGTEWAKSLLY